MFIPWNLATIAGYQLGSVIPDPAVLGLDIVFPAAMAGLAVGLMTGRREIVAAGAGAAIGVMASLVLGPSVGIVVGGLVGPLVGDGDAGRRPTMWRGSGCPRARGCSSTRCPASRWAT